MSAAGARLDELRQFLFYLDSPRNHPQAADLARTSRSWAYVALASCLEEFTRAFLDELTRHINAAALPVADLNLGVVSVMAAGSFDSAAAGRRQQMWTRRATLMQWSETKTVEPLQIGLRPLDGRTIRVHHLESLWSVYELPGKPLPSPLHALALRDLADGRNAVAHGNDDPLAFGRSKTAADVLRRIGQVEDIVLHIAAAGDTYVRSSGFKR